MEINKIPKLIMISVLSLMLIFAGCAANETSENIQPENSDEQPTRGSEVGQDETSNEERVEEENEELEVARRESEELDETQEQINDAISTLSATGSYSYPRGTNTIEVEITVDENNIIQSAQVINFGNLDSTSQTWVTRYNEGIEAEVVGKSLDEAVSPAVVNRSSLTAQGFNEALEALRQQRNQ